MNVQYDTMARELIAREAHYLDSQSWEQWIDLYTDDAVFWIPAWRDESTLTSDPQKELSFIHLKGRAFLEERVHRIKSGRSISSVPMPRTAHLVTSSIVETEKDGGLLVRSIWSSHVYLHKDNAMVTYAGRYEHSLVPHEDRLRIRQKKIILINDYLISKLDFFYV